MLPLKTLPSIVLGENFVESFASVTILFTDIVSYTTLSSQLSAFQVGLRASACEAGSLGPLTHVCPQ